MALAVLCLAAFTINLDTTIVNIALPPLMRQLDASTRELQWVVVVCSSSRRWAGT